MVGGRNNSSRGGRSGRRGRSGRFPTPNHYNNNNNFGYGQSPFPPFQRGMPFAQPGFSFGQGGMPYGTSPGYYGPSSYGQPYFNGAGYNPGQTPGPEAAAAAPTGGNQGEDGFTSPSKKETIPMSALRGTPTPPPKKQIRWNNQFEILEENVNGGEEKEEDNNETKINNDGNKAAAKKKKGKKKGFMDKISDDVAAMAEEIEKEKKKGEGKVVNSYNQSIKRLAIPTAQQSKTYLKLREKISANQPIKISDLEDLKGVHQVAVLANILVQKHQEYANERGDEFDTDKAFDRLKYTNKKNLIKGLNGAPTAENLHEVLKGHSWINLEHSVPTDFPQLIGSDLVALLESEDPDPELIKKGCELLLKRIYMNDEDRVDDFLDSLDMDELTDLASSKGELTKTFRDKYHVNASLPYRIDLEKFPDPPTTGWTGKRHIDQSKNTESTNNESPTQAQEQKQLDSIEEQQKAKLEPSPAAEESKEVMDVDDEPKSPRVGMPSDSHENHDIQMEPSPAAKQPARPTTPIPTEYGKGNFKSKSISQWRIIIQVKKESSEVWKKGNTSNPSLIAGQIISYLLSLGESYGHHLRILPFDSPLITADEIKPLTSEDNAMALPLDKLHKYVGTLFRPNGKDGAWRSFEIKIKTSIMNPQHFVKTAVMYDGSPNLLLSLLDDQHLNILNGTKWSNDSYALWGIANSDETDDPAAIKDELERRIIKLTESPCPEFGVEWQEISSSAWGEDTVVAPGLYITGSLMTEDQLEYICTRLQPDESFPLTGKFKFFKARACSKNYDSLKDIHRNLTGQSNYAKSRATYCINGVSPEILNHIPTEPLTPNSDVPNRKSVRELIREMNAGLGSYEIEKVGANASNNQILIIGNTSNITALKTTAPEVIRKVRVWSGNQDASLDLTRIAESERERAKPPPKQPGMTVYTPQALPPAPSPQVPRIQPTTAGTMATRSKDADIVALSEQVAGLKQEILEMKQEIQGSRPANVSISTEVTDAISSLSDKVESFAEDIKNRIVNMAVNAQVQPFGTPATNIDDLIIRSHIFESQIVNFPEIARDDAIYLPPHVNCDNLPAPHSHPQEEEDKMNRLSRTQLQALIRASPSFVDHSNDNFCLKCITQEGNDTELEYQCQVCNGRFHASCQDIVDYQFENEDPLDACYTCRTIRTTELTVHFIKKCNTCREWVSNRKEHIAKLAVEEQHNLRLRNHILLRENHTARNVQELLDSFQAAINGAQQQEASEELHFDNDIESEVEEQSPERPRTPSPDQKLQSAKASTAASQKGAISGEEADRYREQVATYKSEIYRTYRDTPPDEQVFELAHNWMEDRDLAIRNGITNFMEALNKEKVQMVRDDSESANSVNALTTRDRETAKCLRLCHSLFWITESGKQTTGICPFSPANRHWMKKAGLSSLSPNCECENGYYLDIVELVYHLQHEHTHWLATLSAYVLMDHDIITSKYEGTPSKKIEISPQRSKKLFSSAASKSVGRPKTTGQAASRCEMDDNSSTDSPSNRLERQVLAGIPEEEIASLNSSAKKKRSDSDSTASASKRYKQVQASRLSGASERRTSTRLRKQQRERLLNRADDGGSVTSILSDISMEPADSPE